MPNLELDFPTPNGARPLAGWRLRRLEMLNWGTFHGKVATFHPEERWTLLVGENGSGKSTAVDALRTLLVPPRLLNYNDASGEQKRRDRTRRSYVRGTWASSSQEDSAAALPQNLRAPGEFSILLGVFVNQHTGEAVTLVEILWEMNETVHEVYAIARKDRCIREDLANLGQSRELRKTLKQRGFEAFDSFSAYAEVFRNRLGIPSDAALEVFNQAIGVKEVTDINPFIRRHMLEGSDAVKFIHERLRPHFHELDACWKAIERAEKQLVALAPIEACHARISTADAKRRELEQLLEAVPIYYAFRHRELCERHADVLGEQLRGHEREEGELKAARARDEAERDAKLQELAADETEQSIRRIESQLEAAGERLTNRRKQLGIVIAHLKTLARAQPIETAEQFDRLRQGLAQERPLLKGNRASTDEKRVRFSMDQQLALKERGDAAAELEALRKHRVLIPREFVAIREAIVAATGIAPGELPFAGELIEVKSQYREWTGAIERLLHQLGVSLLVPERHYLAVADFINGRQLGLRFAFHRVPAQVAALRPDALSDPERVPSRLNFRDDHPLVSWLKSEVVRRFHHVCCPNVSRLREVDYGITREGLIRDGPTRHTKDDRRAVNDASNYVLGWSIEAKIKALTAAFSQAESRAAIAAEKAEEARQHVVKLDEQLRALAGVFVVEQFADIDVRSVQDQIARLQQEKADLEASSERVKTLRRQLETVRQRLVENEKATGELRKRIGEVTHELRKLEGELADLLRELAAHDGFEPEPYEERLRPLQDAGGLTLNNVRQIETRVAGRLRRQIEAEKEASGKAREEMLPKMSDFLRDYPEHSTDLHAESDFAADFVALRVRIEKDELKQHRARFEEFLGTNLVGDMAMFQTNLHEHEKAIRARIDAVNRALRKVPFSDVSHVQIVAQPTRTDEIRQFRAEVRECLSGGLNPSVDDRLRIFTKIRELIAKFEKDDVWTKRVTDVRNWLEFGVREIADADNRELNYYSASTGKSGGQKAKLAFTILASAITAQYGLLDGEREADTFRLVVIDEAFARTDEANSRRALDLFKNLGLQLIVVSPFDAKSRIVEDYVDSFHVAANQEGNNSKLCRASRAEYDAAHDEARADRRGTGPAANN